MKGKLKNKEMRTKFKKRNWSELLNQYSRKNGNSPKMKCKKIFIPNSKKIPTVKLPFQKIKKKFTFNIYK